jgi:hypothetical protein
MLLAAILLHYIRTLIYCDPRLAATKSHNSKINYKSVKYFYIAVIQNIAMQYGNRLHPKNLNYSDEL